MSFTEQSGGGLGNIYSLGAPITPNAPIGNTAEVVSQSSCLETARPGMISTPALNPGLPGMRGGATTSLLGTFANALGFAPTTPPPAPLLVQPIALTDDVPVPIHPGFVGPSTRGGGRKYHRKSRNKKRSKSKARKSRTKHRGGRYSFDLETQLAPAAPWAGGIPQVMKIPCETSISNPLNPVQL